MKHRFITNRLLILFTMIALVLDAKSPSSRDAATPKNLTPCNLVSVNLLGQISDKLCAILDIQKYESTIRGGIGVCNLRGPNHDTPNTHCWDYPLLISDDNPTFDGINIVKIKENIIFKPNANTTCTGPEPIPNTNPSDKQAAIIVAKDDMTIDLQGFTISMDGQNLSPVPPTPCPANATCQDPGCIPIIHGIHILPGVKNTRIISSQSENTHTRGSIKKFTGYGIYIDGQIDLFNHVEEVYINNIRVYNCYNGIYGQFADNINITRTETNNNCAFDVVYGMHFVNVSDLYIVGSQSSSNRSCNHVFGIRLQDTQTAFIEDTEVSNNTSFAASSEGSVYGMYLTGIEADTSFSNVIKNCKISGNMCGIQEDSQCIGIYLTDMTAHNIVENCTVISNTAAIETIGLGGPLNDAHAYGIRLHNSNFNEINKNKVGFNANNANSGSDNPGISDTLIDGSTSLFTSNISFFNGYQGNQNYDITFKKNKNQTEEIKTTIIYAANLEGYTTKTPDIANIDVRKAPQ